MLTRHLVLQARMFSYPDAARYRFGVNYQQLPTNCPIGPVYSPMQRDGFANFRGDYSPDPNYVRSSLRPMNYATGNASHDEWAETAAAYSSEVVDDDFVQAAMLWDVLGQQPGQQQNFVSNVAGNLRGATPSMQEKTIGELCILGCCWDLFGLNRIQMFARVDETLAKMIKEAL